MGTKFLIGQPALPDPAPAWWQAEPAVVEGWHDICGRFTDCYVMREYPSPMEFNNHPFILNSVDVQANLGSVRCKTNEPKATDALLRLVNDANLIPDDANITFATCDLRAVEPIEVVDVRADYVRSYTLRHAY